jgi:hypothetical protein
LFSYYHDDGQAVLDSARACGDDDGRRYLERTPNCSIITIDPPPPLQAAGSSLLYSEEFIWWSSSTAHWRILQQWLPATPDADPVDVAAVARSIRDSFPYVRVFRDEFGVHFLCSEQPIARRSTRELIQRMPAAALMDLTEWEPPSPGAINDGASVANSQLNTRLAQEMPFDSLVGVGAWDTGRHRRPPSE